jgi:PadR family transcriptional regulator PadR
VEVPVTAKAALLQVLLEGPGYGTQLAERIQARTKGRMNFGQGSIYPALEKFETEGLIKNYGEVPTRGKRGAAESDDIKRVGGRPRKYYGLTAKGKKLAEEQRESLLGLVNAAAA